MLIAHTLHCSAQDSTFVVPVNINATRSANRQRTTAPTNDRNPIDLEPQVDQEKTVMDCTIVNAETSLRPIYAIPAMYFPLSHIHNLRFSVV